MLQIANKIPFLFALTIFTFSVGCKEISKEPSINGPDAGRTGLTGKWSGSLFTQDGEKVVDIGFQIADDGGVISGDELLPVGDNGTLAPTRALNGYSDGGHIELELTNPDSEKADASVGRLSGSIENDTINGSYSLYPFSIAIPDAGPVESPGYTIPIKLRRTQ